MNKVINRIKVVFAEKKRTNKWLTEQLTKDSGMYPSGARLLCNQILRHSWILRSVWKLNQRTFCVL